MSDTPRSAPLGARDELASLRGLLALSMVMTERGDEQEIRNLMATTAPALAPCVLRGVYELESGWKWVPGQQESTISYLAEEVRALGPMGGPLSVVSHAWGYALPLRSFDGTFGYAIVSSEREPSSMDQHLLRLLAQQTGIALANARLHTRDRRTAASLRETNEVLGETLAALERSTAIHRRLTQVSTSGGDQMAIARVLQELTSYPVVIEDRYGNLRAWAGFEPPVPYPKDEPRSRSAMIRRARRADGPIREGSYVVTIASPREDLIGVLALVDPDGTAGEREHVALEHGATVLAVELARVRAVADSELRLGRDLVDDLVAGVHDERTIARAEGMGYDLFRPHRVIVVSVDDDDSDREALFHAVRRAARDLEIGSLLGTRDSSIVLLADVERDWDHLRREVEGAEGGRCRVGVGDICASPSEVPRSYREAQLALRVQRATGGIEQVTTFDELGVFHILAESKDFSAIDRFVERWLGALREYDSLHHGALVETLTVHLEAGGSYDATAHALSTHRNTVKYRLRRIQEISGFDLADPNTRFNLQLAARALQTQKALEP